MVHGKKHVILMLMFSDQYTLFVVVGVTKLELSKMEIDSGVMTGTKYCITV